MNIGVLDYGAGNLKNVCRAINHLGFKFQLVSTPESVQSVDKLVIPGVGAFRVAMSQLESLNLTESIIELAHKDVPILGICLGMQLLFEESNEFGKTKGLGLLKGTIGLIPSVDSKGETLKVPHIGWNELHLQECKMDLTEGVYTGDAVYFVHSFRALDYIDDELLAYCSYGAEVIPAIVGKNNVVGCQFHPEKSGEVGLRIFENFLND